MKQAVFQIAPKIAGTIKKTVFEPSARPPLSFSKKVAHLCLQVAYLFSWFYWSSPSM
ncbi:MAG: hypothetical protein LBL62_03375 [Planctomycetaceae bacterium]|nr:hypothetical protein [Planctomycetaceae bacterium]